MAKKKAAKKKAAKKKVVNKDAKLKIFVSHKHKDEDIAREIITVLSIIAGDQIRFYLSEDNKPGKNWHNKVHKELEKADWLLLLYTDPSSEWDWCMYETGFFSRGIHDKKEESNHRLICLHHPENETPKNLNHWQSVTTTTRDLKKLLKELFEDINKPFIDNKKAMKSTIETIIKAYRPKLNSNYFSKYMQICLNIEEIKQLTKKNIISKKAEIISNEKSLSLFGLKPKTNGDWHWEDIQKVLVESNQEIWSNPLIKTMADAYEDKDFFQGLPLFQSINDQKFYHPMLHRLDRTPSGIFKFTMLFVPIKVQKTEGETGRFNMILTLLRIGHRFRCNVIEKYLHEIINTKDKAAMNQILDGLSIALVGSESNAKIMGLFAKNNMDYVFDEHGKQEYEESVKNWQDFKKKIFKNISNGDIDGVKENLKEMLEANKDFMVFISGKYHELCENLKEEEELD